MEQVKQSSTAPGKPTTPVEAIADFDYVTVVGCSNPVPLDSINPRDIASNLWNGQDGDKVMFINQGIRQIREYPPATADDSVQRVFLIFTEAYPRALLDEVRGIVSDYGAKYRELQSISDLVDFVSARRAKKRLIKQMDFYSRGVVMQLELGYQTDKEESFRLRDAQARMLDPKAFEWDATICSYACRTGLGSDIGNSLDEGEDPQYAQSLAQILADSADVEVRAFPRRSLYDQTFGTAEDRRVGAEVSRKKKQYEVDLRRHEASLAAYRRRALALGKGPLDEIPGEPPPKPPGKPYTKEQEELALHVESRDMYERRRRDIELPLDAFGAVRPVRSGMTPSGLPMGLMKFTPRAWKLK
ncbi:hypothetical protein [Lysobacter arvi]|uniref:Uncharacterized protein n=1 Tax=Lysobacter arvi TaxID=3038776 RepID=A0ABU1CE28_9GAMM|nr:hypothetical protein [Lysobacter arvi]MDR0183451.1 hypothetical protein [Lysobacter arvi]